MIKKFPLFLILSSLAVSAQNLTTEKKALIEREAAHYAKMVEYNVNPNTLNYDLRYQRLDLNLDPAVLQVGGSVTSHFVPNQNMSSIYFDFTNVLKVSEVLYHGSSVPFSQLATNEIKIDFPTAVSSGTLDSLSIKYSGVPSTANQAFLRSTHSSGPVLFTLSEPYGAQDWFPTKQSMNDKIDRVDIKITTPPQYSVASNGKLMSETILPTGNKLTFWRTNYPTAAYLVALGVTNYTKFFDTAGLAPQFPFVNFVYPSTANNTAVMNNIEWTKKAIENFENYFGPYPFRDEKYGHMEFGFTGTCMEHQTMSSMSSWGQAVIAHELAHQWFGDKITCGSWNDIWLNEGFATFGEHLTNEKLLMSEAQFRNYLAGQINTITSSPGGSVYVSDANLGNQNAIFSSRLSYAKGGYLLRMIKWILGDDAFYQAIKDYAANPAWAYSYAKSADFAASLKASTGKDFTEFFNDWLYGQGYPTYTITWAQNADNSLLFNVKQTQSHASVSFFEMPLPIKVTGTGGEVAYLVLDNTKDDETFSKSVNFPVASVSFNYDYQIIEKNSVVTKGSVLGLENLNASKIAIYPNPANDFIAVSGISAKNAFEIYSIDGKLLQKGKLADDFKINVRSLITGNYILKIGEQTFKFIKK